MFLSIINHPQYYIRLLNHIQTTNICFSYTFRILLLLPAKLLLENEPQTAGGPCWICEVRPPEMLMRAVVPYNEHDDDRALFNRETVFSSV